MTVYRQATKEEMRRIQNGHDEHRDVLLDGASPEEKSRYLAARVDKLEREVALLRTIVLRLVSAPVDCSVDGKHGNGAPAA